MPVQYKIIKQQGPPGSSREGQEVHIARSVSRGTVTTKDLEEKISKMSTVSPADVAAVLTSIRVLMPSELADGNTVRLDGLGTFRVSASTGVLEQVERLSLSDFRTIRLNYRPGKELREMLTNLEVVKKKW